MIAALVCPWRESVVQITKFSFDFGLPVIFWQPYILLLLLLKIRLLLFSLMVSKVEPPLGEKNISTDNL